jgi:uncharacterized protein (TIGR02145 family)
MHINTNKVTTDDCENPLIIRAKIPFIVLILLMNILITGNIFAQSYGGITVKTWADNKKAAFSFTFDDGPMSQYTYAAPILDTFNFKGTFFIISGKMTDTLPGIETYGTWGQFRSLTLQGHEVGSHSVTHPDLTTLPLGDTGTAGTLLYELYQSWKTIVQKIPNQKCITFSYPDLAYDSLVILETSHYYSSARTGGNFPVDPSLTGLYYYKVVAKEPLFNLPRNSTADDLDELADFETYVDSVIKVGYWGLSEIHQVVPFSQIGQMLINGEWYPMSTEWLTSLCQFMKQKSDSNLVWVETMGNVVRYEHEREGFLHDVLSETATEIQLHCYDTLDNSIYNYPLTVDITVPADWGKVVFTQGSSTDTLTTFTGAGITYVRAHVIPDGGTIILNKILPVLIITAPIGGENLKSGDIDTVRWTSINVTNTKIELTTNNGTTWSTIVASTPASTRSYPWVIPYRSSTLCKVRLTDVSDTTISSTSTDTFTITSNINLTITSPNGGETWKVGETDSIKWTSTNVSSIRIEYTTNSGINWTTLISSDPASAGKYAWTIPFATSVDCQVRIVDLADTTIYSISANKFTIANPACPGLSTVVYGGQTYNTVLIGNQCWLKENLNIGTHINVIAEQTNNSIIEKYCYANNPANCDTYGGLYEWAEAVQYQNGTTNTSTASPTLYGHIQGICPTGWHIPDTSEFNTLANTVNHDGNALKAVGQGDGSGAGTDLSGFSALFSGTRYSDGSLGSLGIYGFMISSTEANAENIYYIDLGTDSSYIFLENNSKSYGRSVRCIKDGAVSIQSPNGGESWQVGSNHNITWTSSYFTKTKIEMTTNNGITWSTIIASTPASTGQFTWTIPNLSSSECKIRLTDVADTSIQSTSAETFTIPQIPVLTLTALIQGLYNGTKMIPDTVNVELHNSVAPFALVDSVQGILDTAGVGTFHFSNAVNGTLYYLSIKYRNSIETWSSAAQSFNSFVLNYNFTDSLVRAFGNNMILKGGKYCIYSGDVNQDGLIDLSDLILVDNDNANYVTGFVKTDVNGDGLVDLSDLVIVDNNNMNYVSEQLPPGASTIKNVRSQHPKAGNKQD